MIKIRSIRMIYKFVLFMLLTLAFTCQIKSQVTIGIDTEPVPGALLQLKTREVEDAAPNAEKGLQLPRVALDADSPISGTVSEKLRISMRLPSTVSTDAVIHTGLMIYNTTTDYSIPSEAPYAERLICPGVYIWNGKEWERLMARGCVMPN